MLHVGVNPYGLTYTLGFQGAGTPRVNPAPVGLDGFVRIAREIGARCIELDWRWLTPLDDDTLAQLGDECRADGMAVITSSWLQHRHGETLDEPIRAARALRASLMRLHLTPVLEGARARLGSRWTALIAHARTTLLAEAPKAAAAGLAIGLEDHQDLCSEELLALAEAAGDHVGIVFDTGNPFAVGEDPVAFAHRAARRIRHLHVKDYRAHWSDEGVRLVRCPIGDGCVPLEEIAAVLDAHGVDVTASLEPAALEARHIRFFTGEWWNGYPPRDAREIASAIGRLRHRAFAGGDDFRTPWEAHASPDAIVAYERAHLERSVVNMRGMGWL
jgi:sugar phosphate isomerase/epimerase